MLEITHKWELTDTGAATAISHKGNPGLAWTQQLTLVAQCDGAGSTATIGFEHGLNSTGAFERLGSTAYSVSSGGSVTLQFNGPFFAVRPYVINKTASTTMVRIHIAGAS